MPAMTADQIVDRVRSICVSAPFAFVEATTWLSFDQQPTTNVDGVFRIPPPSSQGALGGFDFTEERTDSMQIWVARKPHGDYAAVRRTLLRDMHSLTAAIVRDGAQVSGDYDVPDRGRGHAITPEAKGLEFISLRLTLPINYEAQL
jgi:hypothetical protein